MTQLSFDAETARVLEKAYQKRDMIRRRRHVREALSAAAGERILDVGCGPGFYARELLDEVGETGSIVAVDASPDMLALARRRGAGHDNVTFREGNAAALPVAHGDFGPGRGGVTGDEVAAWKAEQRDLAEQGEFFFEGTQFCFTARKPASTTAN